MKWKTRSKWIAFILTVAILLPILFPFFVMISTMFKTMKDAYSTPPHWIPAKFIFTNFVDVWSEYKLLMHIKSSLIIAIGTTLLNAVTTVPAAYAVARLNFVGRKILLYLFLIIQMFSPVIIIISLFRFVIGIGMYDTYAALILTMTVFTLSFTIWMMNGYFSAIPKSIEEAALIDGCSRVQIMGKIMIPIAAPGLVTVMIYTFIYAWNDFFFPLVFIQSQEKMPLTLALFHFVGRWSTQWNYLTAATFIALIPVLLMFYLIEKQLVSGLAAGAIKE
jgi:multiple sugar transport system permease protein